MGALAGTLLIPVFFLFVKKLLNGGAAAYFATAAYAFDFMRLSHSRISSIDVYSVLFILCAYYFMACFYERFTASKDRAALCFGLAGLFFGAAVSVKWTGLYAGLGLFAIYCAAIAEFRKINKKFPARLVLLWSPLLFAVFPFLIYCAAHFKYFADSFPNLGAGFQSFAQSQISMFGYHSGLTATHPFSSPWHEWILDIRPLWMYQAPGLPQGMAGTIATMGNPLLIWGGLAAVIYMMCGLFRERPGGGNAPLIILSGFLAQLVPWFFVARVTFIYHYFPIIPFIAAALGCYIDESIIKKGRRLTVPIVYVALSALLFIMYYPVLTGAVVPENYVDWLKILPKWVF
jgi:dolichyl-phosphate-mannose--protein O-mannosyl transferase